MWSLFAQADGSFLFCARPHRAVMHYKHHTLDLLSGRKLRGGARSLLQGLGEIPLNANLNRPKVVHLGFELGYLFTGQEDLVPGHIPLGIELEYLHARHVQLEDLWSGPLSRPQLRFLQVPSWDSYQKVFRRVQAELKDGNCYQLNLTAPFYLGWDKSHRPSDFIRTLWAPGRVGAYAHATWLSTMGKLILSNSPECLVQRRVSGKRCELYAMPIKGTLPLDPNSDPAKVWEQMLSSPKEEGELDMITDLLRNDLSRIHRPRARVVSKRRPLQVPGLLHQYSVISCPVSERTTWGQVVECLFPGGSVTGAPKRRVMGLIHQLEPEPRGLYCGSTWLGYGKTLAASINIRTAELDMSAREMKYGAGGGITLRSEEEAEFEEMMRKTQSFLSPFLGGKPKARTL